jgi:hypothetical protein
MNAEWAKTLSDGLTHAQSLADSYQMREALAHRQRTLDKMLTDRRQPAEGVTMTAGDCIGGFPYAELNCRGCGKPLSIDNAWMTDGCPCNTPLGVNSMNETRWRLLMMLQQREARYTESLERAGDALKAAGDKLLAENAALRGLQGPSANGKVLLIARSAICSIGSFDPGLQNHYQQKLNQALKE